MNDVHLSTEYSLLAPFHCNVPAVPTLLRSERASFPVSTTRRRSEPTARSSGRETHEVLPDYSISQWCEVEAREMCLPRVHAAIDLSSGRSKTRRKRLSGVSLLRRVMTAVSLDCRNARRIVRRYSPIFTTLRSTSVMMKPHLTENQCPPGGRGQEFQRHGRGGVRCS